MRLRTALIATLERHRKRPVDQCLDGGADGGVLHPPAWRYIDREDAL